MPLSEIELQSLIQELMTEIKNGNATNEIIYSLVGIYSSDWVPSVTKKEILEFFGQAMPRSSSGYDSIVEDMNLGEQAKIDEWMRQWTKDSAWRVVMKKKAGTDPLNPIYLTEYFENFKNIMKRQMPNASDEQLYQDAFTQMLELILPLDKMFDIEYLEKIVALAKTLQPPINVEIPTNTLMEARRKAYDDEEKAEQEKVVKEKQQRRERGELTLEEQMAEAIAEERYEDAAEIKQKMDMLQRVMGNFEETLSIHEADAEQNDLVVYADNLDLVQPDKPFDNERTDSLRQRHRKRYRNEPGGSDEVFWEGMDGMKNVDKGIGSDQHSDVGCPSSVNIASGKIKKLVRPTDPNMPNEKMERDPQEEKATTDTWREFNDMQDK